MKFKFEFYCDPLRKLTVLGRMVPVPCTDLLRRTGGGRFNALFILCVLRCLLKFYYTSINENAARTHQSKVHTK